MDNHITFRQAVDMLNAAGEPFEILELGEKWKAIVTRYGGRLLGPFESDDAESVLWVTAAMKDEESFRDFVGRREVHLGGERFWVNPELNFYCEAPELFNSTYTVQEAVDPGHYVLTKRADGVHLDMTLELNDLNNGGKKAMTVARRYAPAADPLKYVKALKDLPVDYCGFVQDIDMVDLTPENSLPLEPWVLTQVNPEGRFVTPFFGEFDFVDYYDPVEDMQKVCDGYAELKVTGDRKYKVAYRSAQTMGRMGFVKQIGDKWHLMIRNYYNDPSIPYVSEPWNDLGNRGCSTYYYNDDLSNGGFAEFENGGATIGADALRTSSHSTTSLWFFFGSQEDIGKIMKYLLGIEYKF